MDWSQIISSLIETGGLAALFIVIITATEKKSAAMLENAKQLAASYKDLADEYQSREAETQKLLQKKEQELLAQIKMNSGLRHSLDDAHTECAVAKLMYCKNSKCVQRDPPFGKDANLVVKEMEQKTQKRYNPKENGNN